MFVPDTATLKGLSSYSSSDKQLDGCCDVKHSVIRAAGVLERYAVQRHNMGIDSYVVVAGTYTSQTTSLTRSTLHQALRSVIKAHPCLCTQLSGTVDGTLNWIRYPEINLDDAVTFSTERFEKLEHALVLQLAQPNTNGLLWRVAVLQDATVVFAYHHALGDGRAGVTFLRSLLVALNSSPPEGGPTGSHIVHSSEAIKLEPPVEDMVELPFPLLKLLRITLAKLVLPRSWNRSSMTWTGRPASSTTHRFSHVRIRSVSPSEAQSLLALCRENKCTLTGFLSTLMAYVLSHHIGEEGTNVTSTKYTELHLDVPIDLRRFTGSPEYCIADQVGMFDAFVPILDKELTYPPTKSSFPWGQAAELTSMMHENLPKSTEVVGLLQFLYKRGRPERFFRSKFDQKRESSMVVSNLGRLTVPKQEASRADSLMEPNAQDWRMEDVVFCSSDCALGPPLWLGVVGSPSGSISITYTWGEDALEGRFADAVVDGMHEGIASIVRA